MSTTTLGLTGDVMLGRNVDRRQRSRAPAAVWGELQDRLQGVDGLLINLECCLSTRGTRWTRTYRPFHFRANPEWAIPALEAAGVDCCCLANNHLLDFGEAALLDTIAHLDTAGIAWTGAGRTIDEAIEPAVFSAGDLRIAVIAFTDNTPEYGADENSPGVARIAMSVGNDRMESLVQNALERARAQDPDLVVASLHWGPNMVEHPADTYETFGRWLLDQGVDLIHGHSAHVFQGIERDGDGLICYDLGDFVDDYAVDPDLRNDRGFFVTLECVDGEPSELRLLPIEIDNYAVHRATGGVADWARERMRELSAAYGTTYKRDEDELVLNLSGTK